MDILSHIHFAKGSWNSFIYAFFLMALSIMLGCAHVGALERSLSSHYVDGFGPCRGEAGVVLEKMVERINEELRRDGEGGLSVIVRFGDDDKVLERHVDISCGRASSRQLLGAFADKLGAKIVFTDEGGCFLCMPGCVPIAADGPGKNAGRGSSCSGVSFQPVIAKLKCGSLCAAIEPAQDGKHKLVCAAHASAGVRIESVDVKFHIGSLDMAGYIGGLAHGKAGGADFIEANGLHQEGGLFSPCSWKRNGSQGEMKFNPCDVVEVDLCRFISVVGVVECTVKVRYGNGSLEDVHLYILQQAARN